MFKCRHGAHGSTTGKRVIPLAPALDESPCYVTSQVEWHPLPLDVPCRHLHVECYAAHDDITCYEASHNEWQHVLNLDRFLQRSSSSRIIPSRLDITSCLRRRICRFSITSDSILTGITHKLAKNIGGKMNMVVLIDNPRGPKMVLLYGPPRGHALAPRGHTLAKTLWR